MNYQCDVEIFICDITDEEPLCGNAVSMMMTMMMMMMMMMSGYNNIVFL